MGTGNTWSHQTTQTYSASTGAQARAATSHQQVFTQRSTHPDLDPKEFTNGIRESRNHPGQPHTTPVMVMTDVTGSMGQKAHFLAKEGMTTMVEQIFARAPVQGPQVAFGAVGDYLDFAPLQCSQFEVDARIAENLTKIWVEGGGYGNGGESYHLAWFMAAFKVAADCFREGRKGYLFTYGDEPCHGILTASTLTKVFGPGEYRDMTTQELYTAASQHWHVFHINFPDHGRPCGASTKDSLSCMGERFLNLDDYTKLPELVVSLMQITEGADKAATLTSWSGNTNMVLASTLGNYAVATAGSNSGVATL